MAKKATKNYHPEYGRFGDPLVKVSVEQAGRKASCNISLQDMEIALEAIRAKGGLAMKRVGDKVDRFINRACIVVDA